MNAKKLIEEVLLDLGNNKSLKDVSTKIQIIVRLLSDDKLKEWYNNEFISGYKGKEYPDYRITQAADIKADYFIPQGLGVWQIKEQSVPVSNLGAEKYKKIMTITFDDTIQAIINYSKHPKDVVVALSPYERLQVQEVLGEAQIQNAHKVISPSTFQSIIDNVQGKIIDLFMDLNDTVFNGEIDMKSPSTKEEIHQVITNNFTAGIIQTGAGVIDARHSTITANMDNSLSKEVISKLLSLTNEIDKIIRENDEEHDEIAQEIIDIRTELSEVKPKRNLLKKSFKALAYSVASISCKAALEAIISEVMFLLS